MRLGLIEKVEGYNYRLTPLGYKYFKEGIQFELLFKNQLLKYFVLDRENPERIVFPYRTLLEILLRTKEIGFLHFAYPISSMYDSSRDSIRGAIEGIEFINNEYPNPDILNETNQKELVREFNELWDVEHTYDSIWTRNTTVYNQMIYFRNHLSMFDSCIEIDPKTKSIKLIKGQEEEVVKLLSKDYDIEKIKDPDKLISRYISFISVFLVTLGGMS